MPASSPSFELPSLKLPKALDEDPRRSALIDLLAQDCRPVWEKSAMRITNVSFNAALGLALGAALRYRQLVFGLEKIDATLGKEKRGLDAAREKTGGPASGRISRLLMVSNDGSERFYRSCERTAVGHGDRLLMIRMEVSSPDLAQHLNLYGREIKALLVSDKEAVTPILLALL